MMDEKATGNIRETTVGLIGSGPMGKAIAQTIVKSGRRLIIFDVKNTTLDVEGALAASSPADVASQASIIICITENTESTQDALLGEKGVIISAHPGDVVVLMTTIEWENVRQIGRMLSSRNIGFVDAPVTGLRSVGTALSLKCFAGGDAADLERIRPVLELMTSEITHWGKVGQGTAFKIVHSLLAQANRIVAAEALAVGAEAGLDMRQMVDVLTSGSANSNALQQLGQRAIDRDFIGVPLEITARDVALQMALGRDLDLPLMMTGQGQVIYTLAIAMGLGRLDGAAVIKVYEALANASRSPKNHGS